MRCPQWGLGDGGRDDCVITSYSIHYTKLYEAWSVACILEAWWRLEKEKAATAKP